MNLVLYETGNMFAILDDETEPNPEANIWEEYNEVIQVEAAYENQIIRYEYQTLINNRLNEVSFRVDGHPSTSSPNRNTEAISSDDDRLLRESLSMRSMRPRIEKNYKETRTYTKRK